MKKHILTEDDWLYDCLDDADKKEDAVIFDVDMRKWSPTDRLRLCSLIKKYNENCTYAKDTLKYPWDGISDLLGDI